MQKFNLLKSYSNSHIRLLIQILIGTSIGTFIGILFTNSIAIGIAFGLISSLSPRIYISRKNQAQRRRLQKLWPEILDHLISGLNSGLSLPQTIAALAQRGPKQARPIFKEFEDSIKSGISYSNALENIKLNFQDSIADQVCEVLDFARSSGSRDSALTLRTLATFVRNDLALRNEINAKHGWIKNAAILAGLAPWLLLIILSTQSSTVKSYSTPAGVFILLAGVFLTVIAYFWMERVGRISTSPRIFTNSKKMPGNFVDTFSSVR